MQVTKSYLPAIGILLIIATLTASCSAPPPTQKGPTAKERAEALADHFSWKGSAEATAQPEPLDPPGAEPRLEAPIDSATASESRARDESSRSDHFAKAPPRNRDIFSAKLPGPATTSDEAADPAPEFELARAEPIEAEPIEAEPIEAEPIEAEPIERAPTVAEADPVSEPEPEPGITREIAEAKPIETGPVETAPIITEAEPVGEPEPEPEIIREIAEAKPIETAPIETAPIITEADPISEPEPEPEIVREVVEAKPIETAPIITEADPISEPEPEPIETAPIVAVADPVRESVTEPDVSHEIAGETAIEIDPELAVADPIESDPIESDPVESDPVESDPVESDPVESDPVESDPVESDPVESDPVVARVDPVSNPEPEAESATIPGDSLDVARTDPVEAVSVERRPVAPRIEVIPTPEGEATYPRTVLVGDRGVIVHPPQIDRWVDFERIEGIAAIETIPSTALDDPRFGVVSFTATAVPDLDDRTVRIDSIDVTAIREGGSELPDDAAELFESAVARSRVVPLDLVLSCLAEGAVPPPTVGVKSDPPRIHVSKRAALLVLLHGKPVLAPVAGTNLQFAANTNWPLFYSVDGRWFLRNHDTWLEAPSLEGPWAWAGKLPGALSNLPEDGNWRSTRLAVTNWKRAPVFDPPAVLVSQEAAELILLVGEPQLVAIGETGLSYVANTESQLFRHANRWYFLVSGRWFSSADLESGAWRAETELAAAFSAIPRDHVKASVLASVPGSAEARMAAFEAQIPTKTAVRAGSKPPEAVAYPGRPEFVPIPDTSLRRAANTTFDVIEANNRYYLCYAGVWYVSNDPDGPWKLARSIPDEIYSIPPSSPVHHVTYVKVYDATSDEVVYGYSAGYSHIYVHHGVAVYGTGWRYPRYYYRWRGFPIYYPYPCTYGSGATYDPAGRAYGSVSRAYGPYGGWGYASGYDPSTGTYGRAEALWDYDEWHAVGAAHNPRTGRAVETARYYDVADGAWKIDSTLTMRRRDTDVSRRFDDNAGRLQVEAEGGDEATSARRSPSASGSEDVYASRDGNVFKRTDEGWMRRASRAWAPATAPTTSRRVSPDQYLDRSLESDVQARRRGMDRSRQLPPQRSAAGGGRGGSRRR